MSTDGRRETWPAGVAHVALDETDSTMAEARRRADQIAGPTWITALRQTAGHGRRGRAWAMPPGNFAGTLVLPVPDPPPVLALRSFVASLALYDAFVAVTGSPDGFALKWPNDVLLNGGKVAGILLETYPNGVAIGIGVNLAAAPPASDVEDGALRPVSLAAETGRTVTPQDFAPHLAHAFDAHERTLATQGFEPIRTAWLARAARLGQSIRARTVTEEHHGTFETVDTAGALVLHTGAGRMTIQAADVYF